MRMDESGRRKNGRGGDSRERERERKKERNRMLSEMSGTFGV